MSAVQKCGMGSGTRSNQRLPEFTKLFDAHPIFSGAQPNVTSRAPYFGRIPSDAHAFLDDSAISLFSLYIGSACHSAIFSGRK
jgi:hypothetical protein